MRRGLRRAEIAQHIHINVVQSHGCNLLSAPAGFAYEHPEVEFCGTFKLEQVQQQRDATPNVLSNLLVSVLQDLARGR